MLGGFFTQGPVTDFASAKKSDTNRYAQFFHSMLQRGIYLAPSQFEAMLLSSAHSDTHIKKTITAANQAFSALR